MTKTLRPLETVELRVERCDGWLVRVVGAVEGLGYTLDRFAMRAPTASAHQIAVTLTVRSGEMRPGIDVLLAALEQLPGVRRLRLARAA